MDTGGQSYYFHRDGLGSIVNLTSASGQAEWSYSYEPFGTARTTTQNDPSAPKNPIRFAGELLDAGSALYNLRARSYDASSGRFTAVDPLTHSTSQPYVGTYVYANDRPGVLADPSGMGAVWAGDSCSGVLGNLRCVYDWFGPWFIQNQLGWQPGCLSSTACLARVAFNGTLMVLPGGPEFRFPFAVSKDFDFIAARLAEHHGIDAVTASERLHAIKASIGLRGDVVFDRTGNVYNPVTGEKLGSLTEGGKR